MPVLRAKVTRAVLLFAWSALLVDGLPSLEAHRRLDTSDGAAYTYRATSVQEEPYGPSEWYLGYDDCSQTSQSPINLSAADEEMGRPQDYQMKFYPVECNSSQLKFSGDDPFFKISLEECDEVSYMFFQGIKYEVLQVHIHSISEHTIGSTHHDAEVHIVHVRENTDDELLVVGILIDGSGHGDNEEINKLWRFMNIGAFAYLSPEESMPTSVYELLPATPSFVHYRGSLTTPPCTEGVKWVVMTQPILVSVLQLMEYRFYVAGLDDSKVDELGNTNRPTQSRHERTIFYCP